VRSSMLHGSETWPVRKDNVVALQQAEMRMVPDQRPLNSSMCVCVFQSYFFQEVQMKL